MYKEAFGRQPNHCISQEFINLNLNLNLDLDLKLNHV